MRSEVRTLKHNAFRLAMSAVALAILLPSHTGYAQTSVSEYAIRAATACLSIITGEARDADKDLTDLGFARSDPEKAIWLWKNDDHSRIAVISYSNPSYCAVQVESPDPSEIQNTILSLLEAVVRSTNGKVLHDGIALSRPTRIQHSWSLGRGFGAQLLTYETPYSIENPAMSVSAEIDMVHLVAPTGSGVPAH